MTCAGLYSLHTFRQNLSHKLHIKTHNIKQKQPKGFSRQRHERFFTRQLISTQHSSFLVIKYKTEGTETHNVNSVLIHLNHTFY